jgi:hypothetical protein
MTTIDKQTELTLEQFKDMIEFRETHRKMALDTSPINKKKATEAVINLYKAYDLLPPKAILFFDSPLAALQKRKELLVKENKKANLQSLFFSGGFDKYWLTLHLFARKLGVKFDKKNEEQLLAYTEYSETCGCAYFYVDVAFVSDRPKSIVCDHQRRLHNPNGPSIEFRDGFAVYSWKGMRIPKEYILNKNAVTPQEIMKIENAELRRVATEIYSDTHGSDAFLKNFKAENISNDVELDSERALYQVGDQKFVSVTNGSLEPDGTRRKFLLGADPGSTNPKEAIASSYCRPIGKYKEAART